ncbi:MAG: hypothetical protein WDM94_13290 [Bauldia sp.]
MKRTIPNAIAALAVIGFAAQPIAANAVIRLPCPPLVADPGPLPMLATVGFMLCAGLTLGKVDADDARGIRKAEKGDHVRALLSCLLPFHFKHKNVVSAKG